LKVGVPVWCHLPSARHRRGAGAAPCQNLHLVGIASQITPGSHAVPVIDGAAWHEPGGRLSVPGNISPLPLPPYSPELNPTGNI